MIAYAFPDRSDRPYRPSHCCAWDLPDLLLKGLDDLRAVAQDDVAMIDFACRRSKLAEVRISRVCDRLLVWQANLDVSCWLNVEASILFDVSASGAFQGRIRTAATRTSSIRPVKQDRQRRCVRFAQKVKCGRRLGGIANALALGRRTYVDADPLSIPLSGNPTVEDAPFQGQPDFVSSEFACHINCSCRETDPL